MSTELTFVRIPPVTPNTVFKAHRPVKATPCGVAVSSFYGVRSRKNLADGDAVTGMALEKFPLPSKLPVMFVVHDAIGVAILVEVNRV